MLCMLLRKYFTGARIISAKQLGFDRIADFTLSCYDEMGFKVEKHMIVEIMGKGTHHAGLYRAGWCSEAGH